MKVVRYSYILEDLSIGMMVEELTMNIQTGKIIDEIQDTNTGGLVY